MKRILIYYKPEYIDTAVKIRDNYLTHDIHISVEQCAMPDKIPFYEKFGFSANEAKRLRIMYHVDQ